MRDFAVGSIVECLVDFLGGHGLFVEFEDVADIVGIVVDVREDRFEVDAGFGCGFEEFCTGDGDVGDDEFVLRHRNAILNEAPMTIGRDGGTGVTFGDELGALLLNTITGFFADCTG